MSWQKYGSFSSDKSWWTWIRLKMFLFKVAFLVLYCKVKIIFRLFKMIFAPKNDFENWKWPIFDCSLSSCIRRYHKIPWESPFGCKKLLDCICQTLKFHNCHLTALILRLITVTSVLCGVHFRSQNVPFFLFCLITNWVKHEITT